MLFPVKARIALNKTFAKITCSEASANSEESPQVDVHLSVSASLLYGPGHDGELLEQQVPPRASVHGGLVTMTDQ